MGVSRFEELRAWQLAARLSDEVHAVCAEQKADFACRDQLRRAADAAPRLIAEGFGRWSRKEFTRYLVMTRSELMEVRNDLRALERRHALPSRRLADLLELTEHTTNTVEKLRKSLNP